MGHSTAFRSISAASAESIMQHTAPTYRSSWGYAETKYDRLANYLVREWCDDPDEDRGDPNTYKVEYVGVVPSEMVDHLAEGVITSRTPIFGIADPKDVTYKNITVDVEVTGEQLRGLRGNYYESINAVREAAEKLVTGKNVIPYSGKLKLPAPRKFQATATEGKSVTKYDVIAVLSNGQREKRSQKDSQAEARAEALTIAQKEADWLTKNPNSYGSRPVSYEVQAVVVREGGNAALVVIARPEPETAKVSVTIKTYVVKPTAKPTAYKIAFDYHH